MPPPAPANTRRKRRARRPALALAALAAVAAVAVRTRLVAPGAVAAVAARTRLVAPAAVAALAARTRLVAPAAVAALAVPLLLAGAARAGERWIAPVPGEVTRGFDLGPDPFEGGRHRGADFAARPGTLVRAACGGPVLVARRVGTSGRVVTIRCGPWRVSHLPLGGVAVRAGAVVERGARIGTAAPAAEHDGLHLGARREGDPFGYTDPLRFIVTDGLPPPFVPGPPPRPSRRARAPKPLRAPAPTAAPAPLRPSPRRARAPAPIRAPAATAARGSEPGLAPWPAWAGLGLLLAGAVGAGRRVRVRRVPARGTTSRRTTTEAAARR